MKQLLSAVPLFLLAISASAQDVTFSEPREVAGCKASDYVVVDADAQIATKGSAYTPKCLKVRKGATVTIAASSHHPLQGIASIDGVNPIFDEFGGAVQAKAVTFDQPGVFGYFCVAHGDDTGAGMAGAIWVE